MRRKRITARDLECPFCGAKAGQGCRKSGRALKNGRRLPPHAQRVEQAARLRYVDARAEQAGVL